MVGCALHQVLQLLVQGKIPSPRIELNPPENNSPIIRLVDAKSTPWKTPPGGGREAGNASNQYKLSSASRACGGAGKGCKSTHAVPNYRGKQIVVSRHNDTRDEIRHVAHIMTHTHAQ